MSASENDWVGLDPTSGPLERKDERVLRPRPSSLDGQVIGLVANGLGRGELLLDRLYEHLASDAEVTGAVRVRKASVSVPPEPADWARLSSEATVAITGFGG